MGTSSRIREILITDMLGMELLAEHMSRSTQVNASILGPNVDRKKFGEAVDRHMDRLREAVLLQEYDRFYAQEQEVMRKQQGEAMMNAFEKLKKDGTIEAFRKRALSIIDKLEHRPPSSSFAPHA